MDKILVGLKRVVDYNVRVRVKSDGSGVSADGEVVVGYAHSASGTEAFRWENGVLTGLGDLTSGTTYVAYGDFREGYTILDRLGINVIMDNITESGFVKWFFRTRYAGGCTNFQAFKRLKAQ